MTRDERMDRALDAALEMTFPASDPIAVYVREPGPSAAKANETTSENLRSRSRLPTLTGRQRVLNDVVASIG
jgi:hypothetical protein